MRSNQGVRGRHKLAAAGVGVALTATSLGLIGAGAGAAGAASTSRSAQSSGGVIKLAEAPGGPPNYIFPVTDENQQSLYNVDQFINLMYPLLYVPDPSAPANDYAHSMAQAPVWSSNDTAVTITLRHYKWSDGSPVTARDCIFYLNLAKAEGPLYGDYTTPTGFPYNIKSATAVGDYTLKLVLTAPINPTYYDDNALGDITPLPQQAWDKESASGPVGNYDTTPAGAKKVLAFLQSQASNQNTYTSNPLWKVVDGPWLLKSYGGASSPDVFVPNPSYSGPKPYASEFEEIPFTSDSAVFASLKTGTSTLSVAAVPDQDIPAIPSLKSLGFAIDQIPAWSFAYIDVNMTNPDVGPILKQAYIRQVLARLTDQQGMIKHFMYGYGYPTYGPVPIYPKNNVFISSGELKNPYPFSISTAESILKAHDWGINPNGTDYCTKGGASGCGAGITTGQPLSFNLEYSSGIEIITETMDLFVSDAAQAGVKINATSEPFNDFYSALAPCTKSNSSTGACTWQLAYLGLGLATDPDPNGVFNTGAPFNTGGYSNPTLDKLIAQSLVAKNLQPLYAAENLIVQDEPWIFQPSEMGIAAIDSKLHGYGLTGEFTSAYIEPNFWYFSK
jgi:peptide/nickel transport system substrate-binding protein